MSVEVCVFLGGHAGAWSALQPHLPPGVGGYGDDYGDALYFTSEWDIEPPLDGLRARFPRVRYQIQAVGDMAAGVRRVHINRRRQRIVTRRARRRICITG